MTAQHRAMTAYGQAAQTLAPLRQIVMLYDGAIRRIGEAKTAILEQRINDRYNALTKAGGIIEGLQSCLDHEQGGPIADQLDRLYTHFNFRLQMLHMNADPAVCDELVAQLDLLRQSWVQLAASSAEEAGPPAAARQQPASADATPPTAAGPVTI